MENREKNFWEKIGKTILANVNYICGMITREYENQIYGRLLGEIKSGVPGGDSCVVLCLQPSYSGALAQYVCHSIGAKEVVGLDMAGEMGPENKELMEIVRMLSPYVRKKYKSVVVVQHLSVGLRNLEFVRAALVDSGFVAEDVYTVSFLSCKAGSDFTGALIEAPVKTWWEGE